MSINREHAKRENTADSSCINKNTYVHLRIKFVIILISKEIPRIMEVIPIDAKWKLVEQECILSTSMNIYSCALITSCIFTSYIFTRILHASARNSLKTKYLQNLASTCQSYCLLYFLETDICDYFVLSVPFSISCTFNIPL